MSNFIPNSFQFPNNYVDRFWHLLTPEERCVLVYIARRIFGFGKSKDRISLTQFTEGLVTRDGKRLDHGAGLGQDAVRRALAGLISYGLVVEVEPAHYGRKLAACYALQLNSAQVDAEGLEVRAMERHDKNLNRTAIARNQRQENIIQELAEVETEEFWQR